MSILNRWGNGGHTGYGRDSSSFPNKPDSSSFPNKPDSSSFRR